MKVWKKIIIGCICLSFHLAISQNVLVEAESFDDLGGWVVDPQFEQQMGSPYLMAHGMGVKVKPAKTKVAFEKAGRYHVWVRTMNWAPGSWEAPGKFQMKINNNTFDKVLGLRTGWGWEYVGKTRIKGKHVNIELHDLTGFNGRCDAIYFSTSKEEPPISLEKLQEWRVKITQLPHTPKEIKEYDLVVVGGGLAGCAASIAAAEKGLKVALIHDRPLLGGNASSEIRVHTLGIYGKYERILRKIDTEHYPNGHEDAKKDQEKRDRNVKSYENIDLFLNFRAYDAVAKNSTIIYVDARHTANGKRIRFKSPQFVDSTGDGWIGFWAGAEFSYGRESSDTYGEAIEEYGELWSPKVADNAVMGTSVLWGSKETDSKQVFPEVPWAMPVAKNHEEINGEWQWEFSRNDLHQIHDAEEIRDHMLKAIYGSFYNAKRQPKYVNRKLEWVSYVGGKRESRRLVGDYIYTFKDVASNKIFPDAVVQEKRAIDVHYQTVLEDENNPDFLSEAYFYKWGKPYYIPYRSLYSKNINNLFMAGRNFSCSHIGLGGPRVMLTTGQMGAAVGYAASVCKKYNVNPRGVYENHLEEYLGIIEKQDYLDKTDEVKSH